MCGCGWVWVGVGGCGWVWVGAGVCVCVCMYNDNNTYSSASERASAQEWWTGSDRSDSWIEGQLNQHFAAAGLPHFVLKHCRRNSMVTSSSPMQGRTEPAPVDAGRSAGGRREAAGPGDVTKVRVGGPGDVTKVSVGGSAQEDGNQREHNSTGAQRRRVPHALGSEEQGAEMWRSKLESLRNEQLALKARMASLR